MSSLCHFPLESLPSYSRPERLLLSLSLSHSGSTAPPALDVGDLVYFQGIAGGLGENMGFAVREDVNSNSRPTTH